MVVLIWYTQPHGCFLLGKIRLFKANQADPRVIWEIQPFGPNVPFWSLKTSVNLKVQLCKLPNIRYMVALIRIKNNEIFAVIAALVLSYWAVKFCL